jgi:FixJ family two-component response regulator
MSAEKRLNAALHAALRARVTRNDHTIRDMFDRHRQSRLTPGERAILERLQRLEHPEGSDQ